MTAGVPLHFALLPMVLVAAGSLGCAAAAPPAPWSMPAPVVDSPAKSDSSEATAAASARAAAAEPAPSSAQSAFLFVRDDAQQELLPAGVTSARPRDDAGSTREGVAPTRIDLAALPRFDYPPALPIADRPDDLPAATAPATHLRKERLPHHQYDGSYIIVDQPLARIQIGVVRLDNSANDRVYTACGRGDRGVSPARWETLSVDDDGAVVLRVVDAWFDYAVCEASVQRVTEIRPTPILGGLAFAFVGGCADCAAQEVVTLLLPAMNPVAATSVSGKQTIAHGAFMQVRLPVERGGAAVFNGRARAHASRVWGKALGLDWSDREVDVGFETSQSVSDERPLTIAWATLQSR